MNLPNESVIILESPEINTPIPKKGKFGVKKPVTRSDTAKKRSPGVKRVRTPLRTVYESIVGRKIIGSRDVIPIITKRKRDRTPGSLTPKIQKKRRKAEQSENNDESVIVLSDDDDIQALPAAPGPSDIIPLVTPTTKTPKIVAGKSKKKSPKPLSKKQRLLQRRQEQRLRTKKVPTKDDDNDDDEDLEIVWSSGDVTEDSPRPSKENLQTNEETGIRGQEKNERDGNFFVDVVGDTSLLLLESLLNLDDDYSNKKQEKIKKKKKNEKKKEEKKEEKRELREIIIDGCNVAMAHANSNSFSEKGLEIVLNYFLKRGHKVTIFIPQHKRSKTRQLIEKWNREGIVVFTPSRKVGNKWITPYDDRYILDYTTKCKGVVISSDQFRDLWKEKPEWRETIQDRLLAPTFVGNYLMFPEDPLGKNGPRLDAFLRF